MRRKVKLSIAFIFFNIFFVVICFEFVLRLFPQLLFQNFKDPLLVNHPYLTVWFKPNLTTQVSQRDCWKSTVSFNEEGLRSLPMAQLRTKEEGWMFVGDSMVQGIQVNNDALFTSILQEHLNDIAIFNVSKSGSGPLFYNKLIKYFLREKILHPHVTRIFYCFFLENDFNGIFFESQDTVLKKIIREYLYQLKFFSILRFLNEKIKDFVITEFIGKQRLQASEKPFYSYPNDLSKEAFSKIESVFKELKEISQLNNVDIIITLVPQVRQILEGETGSIYLYPVQNLERLAKKTGLKSYNLAYDLIQYQKKHQVPYPFFSSPCDGHFSEFGHRIVAQMLLKNFR